ncbi:hypothetical protein CBL_11490 [Carabus blaptoides fortunei]
MSSSHGHHKECHQKDCHQKDCFHLKDSHLKDHGHFQKEKKDKESHHEKGQVKESPKLSKESLKDSEQHKEAHYYKDSHGYRHEYDIHFVDSQGIHRDAEVHHKDEHGRKDANGKSVSSRSDQETSATTMKPIPPQYIDIQPVHMENKPVSEYDLFILVGCDILLRNINTPKEVTIHGKNQYHFIKYISYIQKECSSKQLVLVKNCFVHIF